MGELKTKKNNTSVEAYINAVEDEKKRSDCLVVDKLMREVTGEDGAMWGAGIVGYGSYHYVYASGQEGDWMATGFAARKQALTLYIMSGFNRYDELMKKLGKYKIGKSCLYIKKLEDIDISVLRVLLSESYEHIKKKYPS